MAKRLMKAASSATFLSGNDIGNIVATEIAPKINPATRPEVMFDIACRFNTGRSSPSTLFSARCLCPASFLLTTIVAAVRELYGEWPHHIVVLMLEDVAVV